jgi:membrane associated rhomboid family serine protease
LFAYWSNELIWTSRFAVIFRQPSILRNVICRLGVGRCNLYVIRSRQMETIVRTTTSTREADEWTLVLTAVGIPHRLEVIDTGWALLVPAAEVDNVLRALDADDQEMSNKLATTVPEVASPGLAWAVGLGIGASLVGFFVLTGPWVTGSPWFERGSAAAYLLLHDEPWRAVTALTLHADVIHVVSNAIATALILPPLIQRFGVGVGLWLVLMAGTAGNVITAWAYGSRHVAVGASTATFGAIGILAALQFRPARARARGRRWVIPVAVVLLLTMLGTARGADVLAHAFGLLSGGVLGVLAAFLRPIAAPIQWVAVAGALLALIGCWCLALSGG